MPLSSTPVFPLCANEALEWSWWFGSSLCVSALKGSNGSATFVCVSDVTLRSSRVTCVPGWLQTTPKTSVNRSRLSGDSWSTLLIRSGVLSVGVASALTASATQSCWKSPVIQTPFKTQPRFIPPKEIDSVWCLSSSLVFGLCVFLG